MDMIKIVLRYTLKRKSLNIIYKFRIETPGEEEMLHDCKIAWQFHAKKEYIILPLHHYQTLTSFLTIIFIMSSKHCNLSKFCMDVKLLETS